MVKKLQVYKCEVCGNMVEILNDAGGSLVCCNKSMILMSENTLDAVIEKHVPVVIEKEGKVIVQVGEVEHPMLEKHFIQWIEVITKSGQVLRQYLNPGEKPVAIFKFKGDIDRVREYCNIHGLWSNK